MFLRLTHFLSLPGWLLLLAAGVAAQAQSPPGDPVRPYEYDETFSERFQLHARYLAPEKLYLHTDKSVYSAGETIWLKGYLENAAYVSSEPESNFIYVELLAPDSVVSRVKIKRTDEGFAGYLPLSGRTAPGTYRLRAYTLWMRNFEQDYFFDQTIEVINPIRDELFAGIEFRNDEGGQSRAVVEFREINRTPVKNTEIQLAMIGSDGRSYHPLTLTTGADGRLSYPLPAPGRQPFEKLEIYSPQHNYRQQIYLPDISRKADVQFFPESGRLLAGVTCPVAFKATGPDGRSLPVRGEIHDNIGQVVTRFESQHNGMGLLALYCRENETYRACVTLPGDDTVWVQLPPVEAQGAVVHLSRRNERSQLFYTVKGTPSQPLYLVLHNGSEMYYIQPAAAEGRMVLPEETELTAGIHHAVLVCADGRVQAERVFFVHPRHGYGPLARADRTGYGKRERVQMEVTLSDDSGHPLAGEFSVAVTDSRLVPFDEGGENLVSYFLLSSELKGTVEHPAYYFDRSQPAAPQHLDLVMLTHGWRYYDHQAVFTATEKELQYGREYTQYIAGHIPELTGRRARNVMLTVMAPQIGYFLTSEPENAAEFALTDLDFPDSTRFMIQAVGENGKRKYRIGYQAETFPPAGRFPVPVAFGTTTTAAADNPLTLAREQYYNTGGDDMIFMQEIVVSERRQQTNYRPRYNPSMLISSYNRNQVKEREELTPFDDMLLYDYVIRTFPGIRKIVLDKEDNSDYVLVNSRSVTNINEPVAPIKIVVDGMEIREPSFLQDMLVLEAENVIFLRGNSGSIYNTINGVLLVSLRKGADYRRNISPSTVLKVSPLGWQRPVSFYAPAYETPQEKANRTPDYRSTLYWHPCLVTDENGTARFEFWTSDRNPPYRVVIEGIDEKGNYHSLVQELSDR